MTYKDAQQLRVGDQVTHAMSSRNRYRVVQTGVVEDYAGTPSILVERVEPDYANPWLAWVRLLSFTVPPLPQAVRVPPGV